MTRTFTRAELHALVWSRPIAHLAKDFGLSDGALHNVCVKHAIPKPPPGWWTRHSAGKAVKVTPLPNPEVDAVIRIQGKVPNNEPSPVSAAHEQAPARTTLAAPPAKPDPIVAATIVALRKAKPARDEILVRSRGNRLLRCEVCPASIDRVQIILERLAAAASTQGFRLVAAHDGAAFIGNTVSVSVSLKEVVKRSKHVPTPEEAALLEAWRRKQAVAFEATRYPVPVLKRPDIPEWDTVSIGQLRLELEPVQVVGSDPPRRSFNDGKHQRLEDLADEIAVAIVTVAAAKVDTARRKAEAEQARLDARQRRLDRLRAAHIEERRLKGVTQLMGEAAELLQLQQLLAQLQSAPAPDPGSRVATMLLWVEDRIVALEASLSPAELEERLSINSLFGDKDDRDFTPPLGF